MGDHPEIWAVRGDAARYYGITRGTLRIWIARGHVKAKRTASHWLVDLRSMEAYVTSRQDKDSA